MLPNADIEYYFDHSSCHDKQREDGLRCSDLNSEFGGTQPFLRQSTMTDGCLGPFDAKLDVSDINSAGNENIQWSQNMKLKVGDEQEMVFCDTDVGPFSA